MLDYHCIDRSVKPICVWNTSSFSSSLEQILDLYYCNRNVPRIDHSSLTIPWPCNRSQTNSQIPSKPKQKSGSEIWHAKLVNITKCPPFPFMRASFWPSLGKAFPVFVLQFSLVSVASIHWHTKEGIQEKHTLAQGACMLAEFLNCKLKIIPYAYQVSMSKWTYEVRENIDYQQRVPAPA